MTQKELKKLSRKELISLFLTQTRELDETRKKLAEKTEQLEKRELIISESGSLAEASLKLSGIFEAAQKAADEYLYQIQHRENPDGRA